MTRELKFRVFDPSAWRFAYFYLHNITVPDRLLCQHNYPVQQFTGLKDKNGKEIYEGEIVKISADFWKEYSTLATVMFGDYNCCYGEGYAYDIEYGFFLYDKVGRTFSLRDEKFIYEIVGNAFETPELLK